MSMQFYGLVVLLLIVLIVFYARLREMYRRQVEKELYIHHVEAENQRLERRLTLRANRMGELLMAIQESVLRVDRMGRVLSVNPKAMDLFGILNMDELPQLMVVFYRDPDWLAVFNKALKEQPGMVMLPEVFIDDRVFSPRLSGLSDGQGLLFFTDVTETYQLQAQRKNFIANLMHDLKTPLTSLLGYARSIELFADDEALRKEAVQVISQEAVHVSSLLDDLLSIEQLDGGAVVAASCDVAMVCKQVWQSLGSAMLDKGVALDLNLPEQPMWVAMQEADCYRVVMNVASNAVNYTARDSKVSCLLLANQLRIEDEGEGIPAKDLPHVIERFYRVDQSRARGGHGLGLAIVQETLQRDGGQLELSNREAGGLQVLLQFPDYE